MRDQSARRSVVEEWLSSLVIFACGMGAGMSTSSLFARGGQVSDFLIPIAMGLAIAGYASWRVHRAKKRYEDIA